VNLRAQGSEPARQIQNGSSRIENQLELKANWPGGA